MGKGKKEKKEDGKSYYAVILLKGWEVFGESRELQEKNDAKAQRRQCGRVVKLQGELAWHLAGWQAGTVRPSMDGLR